MIHQHGSAFTPRVVDDFNAEDLGAPFKVVLKQCVSVTEDEQGNILSYRIPDPDGLLRVVVMSRALHPRKLSGADIKYLRKAVGVKQKDLAAHIELDPATLSRCESGVQPIGAASEKLLRIFLVRTACKLHKVKDCEDKKSIMKLLDELFDIIKPSPVHDAGDELVFHFVRDSSSSAGNDNGDWEDEERSTGTY